MGNNELSARRLALDRPKLEANWTVRIRADRTADQLACNVAIFFFRKIVYLEADTRNIRQHQTRFKNKIMVKIKTCADVV